MSNRLRIAVVCDLASEGWPSMDMVADMLVQHLSADHQGAVEAVAVKPGIGGPRPLATSRRRLSVASARRMVDRYWRYPAWLRGMASAFDVYHVVDHSYAHLVHVLPSERTVVTCHDVDAFRMLFDTTAKESLLPLRVVRRVLEGVRRAAAVACVSEATRKELVDVCGIAPARTVVVPNGVEPTCGPLPDPEADAEAALLAGGQARDGLVELLHVGTTIPRKRIDLLLQVFAECRRSMPGLRLRLLRVGGQFTSEQRQLAERLGVAAHVKVLPFLSRPVLAAMYRRAALVLLPSEREGFGLPIVEAMACGTPVVATDLPVLREVGADAASYCRLGDVPGWRDTVLGLLDERRDDPERWAERRRAGLARAELFSWHAHAATMARIYVAVAAGVPVDSRDHAERPVSLANGSEAAGQVESAEPHRA